METLTPSPYVSYIFSLLEGREPIPVLQQTPQHLESILERFNPQTLEYSYAPGKWTAREIFCHLADTELGLGFRFRQALAEDEHRVQNFDQDAWARPYERMEPSLALDTFRSLRAWNLALFSRFSLQDWLNEVHHPERGRESIDMMVRYLAGHDLHHLAQLVEILESERSRSN